MARRLVIPIDGYIEAQEFWHKMKKKHSAKKGKKKGAPHPQWDGVFKAKLTNVPGYAYAVAHHGQLVAEGAAGHARTSLNAPATPWTTSTRINLASVSKTLTTVALLKLLSHRRISINQPFYPFLQNQCPTAGPGVAAVTFKNLLEMKSGMVVDGTLWTPNIWSFLSTYLAQGLVGTPGVTEAYSNTDFTILQAVIAELVDLVQQGGDGITPYVTYVTDHVLKPMVIDPLIFNPNPDPPAIATDSYALSDNGPGVLWSQIPCVGCGGWIGTAGELIKFMSGVRNHRVLNKHLTQRMFQEQLGCYEYNGKYGKYYDHNGWLHNGGSPDRGLNTGIIHLARGYDALLLVNAQFVDTIGLMIEAFEA
jgi:CubicO group peptidase (beta-lactamase class C family)